jgi:hypothetical protein
MSLASTLQQSFNDVLQVERLLRLLRLLHKGGAQIPQRRSQMFEPATSWHVNVTFTNSYDKSLVAAVRLEKLGSMS